MFFVSYNLEQVWSGSGYGDNPFGKLTRIQNNAK